MSDSYDYKKFMSKKALRALQSERDTARDYINRILAEKDAEIASLTEERDRYRAALVIISGSPDRLQAAQAICALANIGPPADAVT